MPGIIDLGWRGKALRNCPNIIVPTLADAINPQIRPSFTWGAVYTAFTAGLAYPYLVDRFLAQISLGDTISANSTIDGVYLTQMQLGKATNTVVATVIAGGGVLMTMYGNTDGTTSCICVVTTSYDYPLACPISFPASTRLWGRTVVNSIPTNRGCSAYLSGYDLSVLGWGSNLAVDELLELGSRPILDQPLLLAAGGGGLVTLTSPAVTAWLNTGTLVDIGGALSDDYLLWGGSICPAPTNLAGHTNCQADVLASSVVQGRIATACANNYPAAGTTMWRWPVIAYKGEQIQMRVAGGTIAKDWYANLYATRLS